MTTEEFHEKLRGNEEMSEDEMLEKSKKIGEIFLELPYNQKFVVVMMLDHFYNQATKLIFGES